MQIVDASVFVHAPTPKNSQRLANTGSTESSSTELTVGKMATIMVGATAIRIEFLPTAGAGSSVATTSLIIGVNQRFAWVVLDETKFVAIEAADGASAYEAWVWTSSPKLI
ncbi:MAG: hypothetical protein HC945_03980 [Nitrosarchaeum sp.]|nr:hypothetical protein [Nitrosarchaeum sp.]